MKSKVIRLLAVASFAAGMVGAAAPAQASTCIIADETLDYVVCDVVYPTTVGTACRVIAKYADCVQ